MIAIQTEDVDIRRLITAQKAWTGQSLFSTAFSGTTISLDGTWAYREVAVPELEKIADEAKKTFSLLSVDIVHRIGRPAIGENILVIVVSAGHRKEAYEGSRFIIEAIKAGVPIWKKDLARDGDRWVPGEHQHGCGSGK